MLRVLTLKRVCALYTLCLMPWVHAAQPSEKTFQADLAYLSRYTTPIVLQSDGGKAQIIVSDQYQGRVLTSTANGPDGRSHGWLDYAAIKAGAGNVGGEDRFWLGPIGSQFSLFYDRGKTFEGWRVPKALAEGPHVVLEKSALRVRFERSLVVENMMGTKFSSRLDREITLFSRKQIANQLGITIGKNIRSVGFQSLNRLTNTGDNWRQNKGLITPWVLGMFPGNAKTVGIFPVVQSKSNPLDLQTYLFTLGAERLKVIDSLVFYRADGRYRSKIGVKAKNTRPLMGSYDKENNTLTIIKFSFANAELYPHGDESFQSNPYDGDVVNSYNHGEMDGSLSPKSTFFELESAAELKALKRGEAIVHTHQTFHFVGEQKYLNVIAGELLNVNLAQVPFIN